MRHYSFFLLITAAWLPAQVAIAAGESPEPSPWPSSTSTPAASAPVSPNAPTPPTPVMVPPSAGTPVPPVMAMPAAGTPVPSLLPPQSPLATIVHPPQDIRPKPVDVSQYADLSPEQPRPIDIAQERLHRLYQNKRARSLKRAYDALNAREFATARKLAAPFLGDPLFNDYGLAFVAQSLIGEARAAFQAKKLEPARTMAEKAIVEIVKLETDEPYSPFIKDEPRTLAMAELVIADTQWSAKKWPLALVAFEKAFQRLSTVGTFEELRPDVLGHYAEACSKKPSELCRSWIQKFNALFPHGSVEIRAISRYYHDVDDMERAPKPVMKLTQSYHAPDLDQAAFDAAMALYLDGKYRDAIPKLQAFIDEYPRSNYRFRARYWLAQALTLNQDHDKAEKEFDSLCKDSPLTWYGLLSAISTGREIDGAIDGALPMAAESDPFLQPGEARHLKRAQYFVVEGATDLAALELRDFKIRDALSSPFLMYLAMLNSEARSYNNTFIILGQLLQRGYEGATSSYSVRMIFPTPYVDLIRKVAAAEGLDPLLVMSLIKQESAFNAGAGSSVGAVGLMQLMPTTAVEVEPDVTRADLLAADVNIQVGVRYLKRMLTRFNGNVVLALAAYNAGPAATDRWQKDTPQGRGMLEFIESIPYRETREYVGSIIRNYYWYSKHLNGEIPKSLAYFWNIYGPPSSQPGLLDSKK